MFPAKPFYKPMPQRQSRKTFSMFTLKIIESAGIIYELPRIWTKYCIIHDFVLFAHSARKILVCEIAGGSTQVLKT